MSQVCTSCEKKWEPKKKEGEEKAAEQTGKTRLPPGWKDFGDGPVCKDCVKTAWTVRAVRLPIARIVSVLKPDEEAPVEVEGFIEHFIPAWRMATDLSNWAKGQLIRHDVRRTPEMTTLPKYVPVNLYRQWNDPEIFPETIRAAWAGMSGTASALLKYVEDTWKGHKLFGRFAVVWKGSASAGYCRFPQPWVVRSQECSVANKGIRLEARKGSDGQVMLIPQVVVNMPGGKYVLELDVNPRLRRSLQEFTAIVTGQAVAGDVKILADTRAGSIKGASVTIAARFPIKSAGNPKDRTAVVKTTTDAMFHVDVPDRSTWILHAMNCIGPLNAKARWTKRLAEAAASKDQDKPVKPDAVKHQAIKKRLDDLATQIRRMRHGQFKDVPQGNELVKVQEELAEYEAWMVRYRTDLKHEKRWPTRQRERYIAEARARIEKHNRRIDGIIKSFSKAVVNFVERQKCGVLQYDDSVRTLFPSWPWAAMKTRILQLCNERGITFQVVVEEPEESSSDEPTTVGEAKETEKKD